MRNILLVLLCVTTSLHAAEPAIDLSIEPKHPWIEPTRLGQALNFDLLVENATPRPLELTRISMDLRDSQGNLIMRRQLDGNGATIAVVPEREVAAREKLLIFNPLPLWPSDVSLQRIEVEIEMTDATEELKFTAKQIIQPRHYESNVAFELPVDRMVLVHAGHDLLSHHRRFPLHSKLTDALGIKHNVTRYAYDFAVVNPRGEMHRGEGKKLDEWFGFGAPVFAPADGTVVEIHNEQPDNEIGQPPRLEARLLAENPKRLFGNYVLLQHGAAEFSLLAHLRMGSVIVKPGERVRAGQRLGAIGMSGDASIVHLHFQAQSGLGFDEALPARFRNVVRKTGDQWSPMPTGVIESGEVVRTAVVTAELDR